MKPTYDRNQELKLLIDIDIFLRALEKMTNRQTGKRMIENFLVIGNGSLLK